MQKFWLAVKSTFITTMLPALLLVTLSAFFLPPVAFAKSPAPNFNLKVLNPNLSGYKNINLSTLRGKVVLVNFWATWCPPCRAEIPHLVSFYTKNRSKNFIIIGVNVNVTKEGVKPFTRQYKMNYPVVYATAEVIRKYGGIHEIPQTFFISKNGTLAFHWMGYLPKNILKIVSKHLMKARPHALSK